MRNIIKYIEKYDENLTIAQLKQVMEADNVAEKKKETEEINSVKSKYENTYLKYIDDSIFGGTELTVIKLNNYVRNERTVDWNLVYYFNGLKISFNKREIFFREFNPDRCGNSYSAKELEEMTEISEKEYKSYLKKYNKISAELKEILL